jgi:hypothetical protein
MRWKPDSIHPYGFISDPSRSSGGACGNWHASQKEDVS